MNSRAKGCAGERELRDQFREAGFNARRTAQYCGYSGDASDVLVKELPRLHFEGKRCQKVQIENWMAQARRDAHGKIPVVCHRRNHAKWLATLDLAQLLDIIRRSDLVERSDEKAE